jgi:hypothetical protein
MDFIVWQDAWNEVSEKFAKKGLKGLSPDERLWMNIRNLIDITEENGIVAYYYDPASDRMAETIEALKKINAIPAIAILEELNLQFPEGFPPHDTDERIDCMEEWDEALFEPLFDRLDDDFYDYIPELEILMDPIVGRILKTMES